MDDGKLVSSPTETLVPGIDIEVIVGCADTRQIKLRTMIAADTPVADCHALVDKVFAVGDRQRARYDLEAEEEGYNKVCTTLTALFAGLPIAERNHVAAIEKLKAEMEGLDTEYQAIFDEGYNAHVASGRTSAYKPKGGTEVKLRQKLEAGKKAKDEITRLNTEARQKLQEVVKSIEHYREDLAKRRAKVNGLLAIAGQARTLAPISEETCPLPELPGE